MVQAGVLPDLTGFHAKRLEFEPEYDAEAEALLADLEFRYASGSCPEISRKHPIQNAIHHGASSLP